MKRRGRLNYKDVSASNDPVAMAIRREYIQSRRLATHISKFNAHRRWDYCWVEAAELVRELGAEIDTYVQAQFEARKPYPSPDAMYGPAARGAYFAFLNQAHKCPFEEEKRKQQSEWIRFKSRVRLGDDLEHILESPAAGFTACFKYLISREFGLPISNVLISAVVEEMTLSPSKCQLYQGEIDETVANLLERRKAQR